MINVNINNMILISIIVLLSLICLGIVIYIFYKDRKKDEEEIAELTRDIDKREEQIKKKAVEEVEFVEKKSEIEEMLERMQRDLEAKTEDVVEQFEQEQEEKSIISYQELVKSLKGNKEDTKVETLDKKDKTESIDQINPVEEIEDNKLQDRINKITKELENQQEELVETSTKEKKFKNTEFISPVYGKMEEHLEYPTVQSFEKKEQVKFDFDNKEAELELETRNIDDYLDEFDFKNNMEVDSLEKTLNMPPISADIKKNDEFLKALKEFRKNLE